MLDEEAMYLENTPLKGELDNPELIQDKLLELREANEEARWIEV